MTAKGGRTRAHFTPKHHLAQALRLNKQQMSGRQVPLKQLKIYNFLYRLFWPGADLQNTYAYPIIKQLNEFYINVLCIFCKLCVNVVTQLKESIWDKL